MNNLGGIKISAIRCINEMARKSLEEFAEEVEKVRKKHVEEILKIGGEDWVVGSHSLFDKLKDFHKKDINSRRGHEENGDY